MRQRKRISVGVLVAVLAAALPLTTGVECSRNSVAQSAATTAANAFLTNLIDLLFANLDPA